MLYMFIQLCIARVLGSGSEFSEKFPDLDLSKKVWIQPDPDPRSPGFYLFSPPSLLPTPVVFV